MVPARWTDSVADTLPGAARHTIQAAKHAIEMCVFVLMARQTLKRNAASVSGRILFLLGYRKLRSRGQDLIPVLVGDLQLQGVLPRCQFCQRQQFFDRHLRGRRSLYARYFLCEIEDLLVAAI